MIAIIFLLLLTLGNAILLRHDLRSMHLANWAPVHLGIKRERHYGWDLFVWREIAAIFTTMVLFGIVAALRPKDKARL